MSKINGGPPGILHADFAGGISISQKNLEGARIKYIIDKVTGRIPGDLKRGAA